MHQSMPGSTAWLHSFFIQYKKVVFPSQAEYSYFSAKFRLKIFLCYFLKKKEFLMVLFAVLFIFFGGEFTIKMYYKYRSSNGH